MKNLLFGFLSGPKKAAKFIASSGLRAGGADAITALSSRDGPACCTARFDDAGLIAARLPRDDLACCTATAKGADTIAALGPWL